jgi:methanol metabolism-related c-type cytochrome
MLGSTFLARALAAAGVTALGMAGLAAHAADQEQKPYTVVGGKVDQGTYNGYRRYGESCLRCHGPDGAGSSYAPSLVDSLKTLSYEDFVNTVVNGKQTLGAGQEKVMPAFGEVQDVMLYIDDIYAYLKARSDGALGRGRPERLPADQDPKAKE